jgi:flagellum-specific peptidoglycan hydrolase FlgJ
MSADHDKFISKVWASVREVLPDAPAKVVAIVVAHAGYESGWGVGRAYRLGRNLFNITRLKTDPRPIILSGDLEYGKDGSVKKITQRFAAYSSERESVEHYLKFITAKRYENAKELLFAEDAAGYLSALSRGDYFTLPLAQYLAGHANAEMRVLDAALRLNLK